MVEADDSYVITVLGGLALVGIVIQMFFGGSTSADGSTGPANAAAWGYGVVAMALSCLLFVTFALTSKIQSRLGTSSLKFASAILDQSVPVLMLLLVVGWLIGLNITYWNRINTGNVAAEYTQFSKLTSVMVGLEVLLVLKWLGDEISVAGKLDRHGKSSEAEVAALRGNQMRYISYVMTAMNFVFAVMMTIVLKYFSTDG